jgi:hypothetical protein
MSEEMNDLFPKTDHVEINGEVLEVKPFKFGQLPVVLKNVKNVYGVVQHYMEKGEINSPEALIGILAEGGDELMNLLALAVNRDKAIFDDMDMDVGAQLLLKVVEQNMSFFVERILPMVGESSKDLVQTMETESKKIAGKISQ